MALPAITIITYYLFNTISIRNLKGTFFYRSSLTIAVESKTHILRISVETLLSKPSYKNIFLKLPSYKTKVMIMCPKIKCSVKNL